ncbi:MAG: hypothetical protein ACP5N3_00365 [Candidatus Nanoarchaeia archaeon]
MVESKNEDNPMFFYVIIILALGLVAYKWYDSTNKTELYHNLIIICLIILGLALVLGALVLLIRGHVLKEENSKKAAKIPLIVIGIIIIGSFVYRTLFVKIFFDYSYIFHGVLSLAIFSYYNFKVHFNTFKKITKKKAEQEKERREIEEIQKLLRLDLDRLNVDELENLQSTFKVKIASGRLKEYNKEIWHKLVLLPKIIEIKEQENKLQHILKRKDEALDNLRRIQDKKQHETMTEEGKIITQLYDLKEKGTILKKEDLTEEEIDLLLKNGYKQVNEYCVYAQKIITVLVKPVLNHSPTHIFLVWSVMLLLGDFGVTNLRTHDTREADITFTYKHQCYAIEIETGSLLTQRKQLEEKVKYLNRRYPKRWFFVVSNKNLQPKYRKYGIATQRVGVEKFLKKMLKIRTQN